MALSGIQIYKLLPQTNCKECGFPTCLAFAMKLAAKQVELSTCPYVSEASKTQLAESAAPPIRLVSLKSAGFEVKAGNEVVLFRHEKTFYNKPGLFIQIKDDEPLEKIQAKAAAVQAYTVNYVGIQLNLDGFIVVSTGGAEQFAKAVGCSARRQQPPADPFCRRPAGDGCRAGCAARRKTLAAPGQRPKPGSHDCPGKSPPGLDGAGWLKPG